MPSTNEIAAKPQIYAEADPKAAIRALLSDFGWQRGSAIMPHVSGPVGYDVLVENVTALIGEFMKRAGRRAQSQQSVTDQLIELRDLAIKAGLYDADDAIIKLLVNTRKA